MPKTYTKKAVKWMLIVGSINGMLPFILSAFGKDPVTELGLAWVTEIVAVILGYLIKSFKENKQMAIQRHEDLVAGIGETGCENNIEESTDENNDERMEA